MSENTLNQLNTKSTTKPASPSHSNKKNSPFKKIIIILLILLIIGGIILFLINYFDPDKNHPKTNTLYTGLYNNQPVLFFRNKELGRMDAAKNIDMGRYMPYKVAAHAKHHSEDYINFHEIQKPKALFEYERFATIENFLLSDDGKYLVISFLGGKNDKTNYIYQSNLKTGNSKKIFEHEFLTGDAPYNGGVAYITSFIPEKYVVFEFILGSPPPASAPGGVVVKNIKSGNEKVLGIVGDVNLDLEDKKVTFKNLQQRVLLCQKVDDKKDPDCFPTDTYKTGFTPEGDTLSQPLP